MQKENNKKFSRLLMISTDRLIFDRDSEVRKRQIEYAKEWGEVHIIIFCLAGHEKAPSDNSSQILSANCFAYSTNSLFVTRYPFDAMRMGKRIGQTRGITHITCQDAFLTGYAGAKLKKVLGAQLEMQIHTDIGSPHYSKSIGNKIRKFVSNINLKKADKVRVVSERIKSYVQSLNIQPQPEIEVRPIFVDVDEIKQGPVLEQYNLRQKYPQFEKIILMASRIEKEKNIELAINAWNEVVKNNPKTGLIIVGGGSRKDSLRDFVSDLGLSNSVIFEPWANREALISYYKTADAFLNTSYYEGYGMTLVEAHSVGCPVISTDVGVASEIGATIIDWTPESLSKAVINLQ